MKNLSVRRVISTFKKIIHSRNNLFFVYLIVLLFLIIGVYYDSGYSYLPYLICYSAFFIVTYLLIDTYFRAKIRLSNRVEKLKDFLSLKSPDTFALILFGFTTSFIVFHFIYLKNIPTVSAFQSHNSFEIFKMRNAVSEKSSTLVNYLSSFVLKAIIPFSVLYFFIQKKRYAFIIVLVVSAFYCLSLIAKSFLVTAFIPVIFLTLFSRKYFASIGFFVLVFAGLNLLVFVANPALRGGDTNTMSFSPVTKQEEGNGLIRSVRGLTDRVFLTPGKIVSGWFEAIPKEKPYLNGCGYRFLAPVLHCEYREYASELYPVLFPEFAKQGYAGRVNAASFMYDYSNFGWVGIILSAILMAVVFVALNILFAGKELIKFCINIYYVLVLSSSALSTLLLSGGWGLMILLFLICRKNFSVTE